MLWHNKEESDKGSQPLLKIHQPQCGTCDNNDSWPLWGSVPITGEATVDFSLQTTAASRLIYISLSLNSLNLDATKTDDSVFYKGKALPFKIWGQ